MNLQKITDDIIRERLGRPMVGMACGGHVKKGYADAGPVVLNEDTIAAMNQGFSPSQAIQSTRSGMGKRIGSNYAYEQQADKSNMQQPMYNVSSQLPQSQPDARPSMQLGLPAAQNDPFMKQRGGITGSWQGAQSQPTPESAGPPKPEAMAGIGPPKPPEKSFMEQYGLAQGGTTLGLIKGKVNPNVADDTTITTPSGATINAKKGEFVLSVDDVQNLGGPEKVEMMVKMMRKMHGQPMEMGPKDHDEPDNYGRMDKEGMADGGSMDRIGKLFPSLSGYRGEALPTTGGTPSFVDPRTGKTAGEFGALRGELVNKGARFLNAAAGSPLVKGLGLAGAASQMYGGAQKLMQGDTVGGGVESLAGAAGLAGPVGKAFSGGYAVGSLADAGLKAAKIGGYADDVDDGKAYGFAALSPERQAKWLANKTGKVPAPAVEPDTISGLAVTPNNIALLQRIEAEKAAKQPTGPTTTPEQDEASRLAAQTQREAGYAASSAQQDVDRANLARQERMAAQDKLFAGNLEAQKQARIQMGTPWWAGGTAGGRAAAINELRALQDEAGTIGEQGRQVRGLEGIQIQNEGLPEQRRAGIQNDLKRLGLSEKQFGLQEQELGLKREEMGLRKEDRITDREIKKLGLEQAKQQSNLGQIPYDAIMKLPANERLAAYQKVMGKKDVPDAKILENLEKISALDPIQQKNLAKYFMDKGDVNTARMLASMSQGTQQK